MKQPLLPVAMVYAAGIVLARWVDAAPAGLFCASLALGVLALFWQRPRAPLLGALLFFAGWTNLTWRTAIISPHDVRLLAGDAPADVTLRGRLCGVPSERVALLRGEQRWHVLAPLEVQAIRFGQGDWQPAAGTVQTTTRGSGLTNLFLGQAVEVSGVLAPPPGPLAPGLFDYASHLRSLGIYHLLRADSPEAWRPVGPTGLPPWTERFRRWAQVTLARGLPEIDEPLQLQWAMVLGWKTALTGEVSEPFMRSGTMHIFAISGLHIVLIAGILTALLRFLNLPRLVCGAVVIPLIWFYTAATEWQASAIRSTLMMTIVIAGWSLRRPGDLLNSLAAAAFLILLWDPGQLFQASFQLSFGAVLSLALVAPPFDRLRQRWLQPDPLVPDDLRPRWQRWLWSGANTLVRALTTSLAAWIGTGPLIATYFHLFTPVNLVANVVVVPLSGFALMCGLGAIITGSWFPWVTECFNHAGWFFMLAMVKASQWSAALPKAYAYVQAPGLLFVVLYYALLLAWLGGWLTGARRLRVALPLGALAILWLAFTLREARITRATILPLEGAHAVWLNTPGRAGDWLVDCGDARETERITLPFLRSQGVNRLRHLVLTHGDVRHVGGATNLMDNLDFLCASPVSFRSAPYRRALATWTNLHGSLIFLRAGQVRPPWAVLHPAPDDRSPQADDKPLVLSGQFSGTRLLLLSDLSPAGQNALLQRQPDLRADVVVTGLPAGAEPLHEGFLDAVRPQLIIVADGSRTAGARPEPALVARLRRRGLPVLYLHESRAVSLEFRTGHWTAAAMDGFRLQGAPAQSSAP